MNTMNLTNDEIMQVSGGKDICYCLIVNGALKLIDIFGSKNQWLLDKHPNPPNASGADASASACKAFCEHFKPEATGYSFYDENASLIVDGCCSSGFSGLCKSFENF